MKITVTDVLKEGNWSHLSWSPRIADDTAFQTWVESIAERASAYTKWRVGDANYDSANEPLASILEEAEMHVCQEQLLLAAAIVSDAARDATSPPFLATGAELRNQAKHRRERAEELLAPYDQGRLRRFARPRARTGLGAGPVTEHRLDEVSGRQEWNEA
jgi:hypothetical protein